MRFFSPLLILVALLAAACGGAAVFPEVFSQERADGKIPVNIELIRQQTRKEIDGMPEGQAKAERWRQIEKDHNQCRLLSARSSRAEANEVFAACMSKRDYLYMFRLDAEHLHNDIAAAESVNYAAEKKAIEDARLAAEKKAAEERQRKEHAAAVERQRERERRATERRQEEEARREAAHRREQERLAAEHHRKQQEAERKRQENRRLAIERRQKVKHLSAQLINAAKNGDLLEARWLIANGANPNAVNSQGSRALWFAVQGGHTEIAKLLLSAGANPNIASSFGWTNLMTAASRNYSEIVKALLSAGAKPNAVHKSGETALDIALNEKNAESAQVLFAAGARTKKAKSSLANLYLLGLPRPRSLPSSDVIDLTQPDSSISSPNTIAVLPKTVSPAAQVFESTWQNIVVVRQGEKQGSGVIVRPNVVATNCHVIDSGGDIVIYKHDNRRATTDTTYNAIVRKRDTPRDFCLLTVAGLQGTPAKLRRYNTLDIGENVYAVGSPSGLDLSLSSGIISQLRQGTNTRYIQTDASVSPGSSGGGLFDSAGNLIGILTAKIADEDVEGIGFAIPADLADNL